MRTTLSALALVLVACGHSDRRSRADTSALGSPASPPVTTTRGPDQLALRFPRDGGPVRAFAYPKLDSLVWTSTDSTPAVDRVLAFDDEAGSVAAVDARGRPLRVDLHLGTVSRDLKPKLTHIASTDGSAIYGIDADGNVVRLTPSADWTFTPPAPARDAIPEPDGSLLVLADRDDGTTIWQMHPPDRTLTDTANFPRVTHASRTQVGDRVYFVVDSGLVGLRSRGLVPVPAIHFAHHVRALTTTPSGDRIYVAVDSSDTISVVDRYTHKIQTRIALGAQPAELRVDPVGRYVLARPARGDSAWVIAVGTDHLVGTVDTRWRTDLPTVAPNGWLALLHGRDVAFVAGGSLRQERVVKNGAEDDWLFITWNGFRPRPAGLDQPVTFGDSTPSDSAAVPGTDTNNVFAGAAVPGRPDSAAPRTDSTSLTPNGAVPARPASATLPAPAPLSSPMAPRPATTPTPPATPNASPAPPAGARGGAATAGAGAHPALPGGTGGAARPLPATPAPRADSGARGEGFTVQFAALTSEAMARATAGGITVPGTRPRIVPTVRGGETIYRVVIGPFPTHDEAERLARTSGKSYWIYAGAP